MIENNVGKVCWTFPDDATIDHIDNPAYSYLLDRAYPPGTSQVYFPF